MRNKKRNILILALSMTLAAASGTAVHADTKADYYDDAADVFKIATGLEIEKGVYSSTLETAYFTIDMPGTDSAKWSVECASPGNTLTFYCQSAKDAGNGGVVMYLTAYDWGDDSYADIPESMVAGMDEDKIYVAYFPTDLQYDPNDSSEAADYAELKSWMEDCKRVTEDSTYTIFTVKSTKEYRVEVDSGYLALRSAENYDTANEIGQLYTGDTVTFLKEGSSSDYWYVYSESLDKEGYVNKNYLVETAASSSESTASSGVHSQLYEVKVDTGYLALRSAQNFDSSNEIGQLYTGDLVTLLDSETGSDYWRVYSWDLELDGYVNKNYLVSLAK